MASHTHSELELAAAAFGDAARDVGIEPQSLQRPVSERVPVPEPEPAYALDDDFGEWAEPVGDEPARELQASVFDGERSGAAVGGARADARFGGDRPAAPFDIERELQPARAA
jgi:hypothetical protein